MLKNTKIISCLGATLLVLGSVVAGCDNQGKTTTTEEGGTVAAKPTNPETQQVQKMPVKDGKAALRKLGGGGAVPPPGPK